MVNLRNYKKGDVIGTLYRSKYCGILGIYEFQNCKVVSVEKKILEGMAFPDELIVVEYDNGKHKEKFFIHSNATNSKETWLKSLQCEEYFLTETEARKNLKKEFEEIISKHETLLNKRLKLLETLKSHVKYADSHIKEMSKAAHLLNSLMYNPFSDDFHVDSCNRTFKKHFINYGKEE